jgi:uncharacterized LabA/DUF88 family protein
MPGNAALLIDLENFYIGREDIWSKAHGQEPYEFPVDLDSLCSFAKSIAGDRRLIVQRAYANFNDRRPGAGERRWDYYLQPQPRFLMEQGIEPVQVFRFPGGNNKNAADMKMAMDATALLQAPSSVDFFVIVTGDSDFIPLVLELKRAGAEAAVIGVTGCTKPIFERYCDRFEYFEDLLAARELQRDESGELDVVREAIAALVSLRSPIKFAAVKPLLSEQLGASFDPMRYGCESTGDFLRKNAAALGIEVRRGEHDWELAAAGAQDGGNPRGAAVNGEARDDAPSAEAGSLAIAESGDFEAMPLLALDAIGIDEAPPPGSPSAVERSAEPHTAKLYRDLLKQGIPRCYVVDYDDWNMIVDAVYGIAAPAEGQPPPQIVHQELLEEVTEQCSEQGMVDAGRKVRDVCFQLFKAGCFHCAEAGAEPSLADFHWSRPAVLDPRIEEVDHLVERAWSYLAQLLSRRLEQRGNGPQVQAAALSELFAGPDPTDEDVAMIARIASV